jgi:hypothetical protein
VVFAPIESFPDSVPGGRGPGRPDGPPAVRGDVVARLALPPDVEILSVAPDRFLTYVGAAGSPRAGRSP